MNTGVTAMLLAASLVALAVPSYARADYPSSRTGS
jgi:hypothetical protein